jgi:ABC-type lipoprotein release transport system permease subunit
MMKNIRITAAVFVLGTIALSSCYSVMPISNTQTKVESKANGKTVIVYYDATIGTDAIEQFIKKNDIEVLYRYNNIHGYALKLKNEKQRKDLEKTKGVLSVQDDRVIQLD